MYMKGDIDGLVKACGYVVKDADYYTYSGTNYETLRHAWKACQDAVEPAEVSLMDKD